MAENVGKRLQEARRNKEISLHQVSEETKIAKKYLEALEKERYDVFPAKIYVVSFLRNYARYLGLDAESLVHIYKREHSGQKDKMDLNPKFPIVMSWGAEEKLMSREGIAALRFTNKSPIAFILAIGVVVGAGLSAIFFLQSASRQLSQQVKAKINVSTSMPKDISIVAEINDKTWLRVIGDGVVSFEGTLFPGEKKRWVAKNEMNVRIGNVDGVKLYMNGKDVDTISEDLGKVNELIFTRLKGKGLIKMEQKGPLRVEKVEPLETELQEQER
ncbi:MAG: helix-turn-helix domain-containing protein [bacterium]